MKICLVTTFPPSTGGLSEYGFHIAQELQRNPFLSLTILADELGPGHEELEGFSVNRCWSFDDPGSSIRLMNALRRVKPDVVWFNLLFSTFGRNPVVAFSGLMTPLLARLTGRYTHVTLHHLMDTVELKDAGVKHEGLYRAAGAVATRMLLLSNSVSVLMPGYRQILNDKYGRDNVHLEGVVGVQQPHARLVFPHAAGRQRHAGRPAGRAAAGRQLHLRRRAAGAPLRHAQYPRQL